MGIRKELETTDLEKIRAQIALFLNAMDSNYFPKSMIQVLRNIGEIVAAQFDAMTRSLICLFLFVRFFCPVLVSPNLFGLIRESPNQIQQKNLILISKLLNNISSGVRFDSLKEEKMIALNPLVDFFSLQFETWFDRMLNSPNFFDREKKNSGTLFSSRASFAEKEFCKSTLDVLCATMSQNADAIAAALPEKEAEKFRVLCSNLAK